MWVIKQPPICYPTSAINTYMRTVLVVTAANMMQMRYTRIRRSIIPLNTTFHYVSIRRTYLRCILQLRSAILKVVVGKPRQPHMHFG